jgi:chemosensory pili system protein ChpA (sensor histidine kinase/response regulator)
MSAPDREALERFLQDASEHLQILREYAGVLQEDAPREEDVQKLFDAAGALTAAAANHEFPLFSEIAGKLAHVFQYARNAALSPETRGPLTEFLADGISVLEFDLLEIGSSGSELAGEIAAFKLRYAFAFPEAAVAEAAIEAPAVEVGIAEPVREVFPSGDSLFEQLPDDGEVPSEVLEFFLPEAEEHLQVVTDCLLALEANASPEEVHRLFRSMHTVKGSAAQVGLRRIAAVAHRAEDLIGQIRDGELQPSAEVVDVCLEAVDTLKKFLRREWESEDTMRSSVGALLGRLAEFSPKEPGEESTSAPATGPEGARPSEAIERDATAKKAQPGAPQSKTLRIPLDRLDRMMNAVGELIISRTRMIGRLAELGRLIDVLSFSKRRLSDKVSEFQEKYDFGRIGRNWRNPTITPAGIFSSAAQEEAGASSFSEFTELEMDRYDDFNILSRSMTEISADVTEVLTQLSSFMGRSDADIDEFTKLAHHLQDEITQARMVPIGNLYTRLSRTARDAAKEAGKQVDLSLEGAETSLDNNIIQQISDPLIHLIRNCVAHGVEFPQERVGAGKPPRGRVSVRAYHRGNHIFIEVEDDGRGINYERVRARAVEAGLISPGAAEGLTERELQDLLFHPGISTATSKTELSGRGVGLDVVRANVHGLNGEIEVRSQPGAGTCFTLKVPLTLIISQALYVRCGSSIFALPLALVEEIRRIRPEEIDTVGGKPLTKVRDVITEVVRLDVQLGLAPLEPVNGSLRLVIVKVAGRQVGILVEEVIGKDEIVIKSLGEYLRKVKLFPGTTIAPDGSLILLIDLNRLVSSDVSQRPAVLPSASAARVFAPGASAVASGSIPVEATDTIQSEALVLVVDDSISVRKFVGRMLEKAGYRVRLASDGLEASEVVVQTGCHLIITDLEMPRMNGYELMAHLRQDPTTRRIPVLVVTSRAGAKHRDRAMKEGAAGFLTKPVQEEQLLAEVKKLIGEAAGMRLAAPVLTGPGQDEPVE